MICTRCKHQLKTPRSIIRGMGDTCFEAHLAEIEDEERRFLESMTGYAFFEDAPDSWMIVTPEHERYRVQKAGSSWSCDCPVFRADCKHIQYVRLMTNQPKAEPLRFSRWTNEEIEKMIAEDFE